MIGKIRKPEPHLLGKLLISEHVVSSKEEIANEFNIFYTNIGPESAKKYQKRQGHLKAILKKWTQPCQQNLLQLTRSKRQFFH